MVKQYEFINQLNDNEKIRILYNEETKEVRPEVNLLKLKAKGQQAVKIIQHKLQESQSLYNSIVPFILANEDVKTLNTLLNLI